MFFSVTGTIDGKFDCGYLVTVKLGSEVLRGVLYHPEQPSPSNLRPQSINAIVPYTGGRLRHSGRRHRRSRRKGDPNHPKPNRSGYNFFFAEKHYKLKSLYPNREREFTKMIGESWNNLSPEERTVCLFSLKLFPKGPTVVNFSVFDQMSIFLSACVGLSEHWAERQGKIQERVERVQGENEAGN